MDLKTLMLLKAAGGGTAVEKTASGNPAVFTAGLSKMLKKLAVPLTYEQPGSGNPSLANIRPIYGTSGFFVVQSGKNMAYLRGYSAANRGYDLDGVLSNSYGTTISTTDPVRSLVITQSDSTVDYDKHNYRNGYLSIRSDNMVPGMRYDISFRVTDILSNPLNASLSDLQLLAGSGTGSMASEIVGDTVIWRNFTYREAATYRQAWELRNCGMSFTLSDFLITPAGTTDGEYEPYTGGRLDVVFPAEVGPVFGGELDVVSGELRLDYVGVTFRISDYSAKTDYDGITFYDFRNIIDAPVRNNSDQKCSIARYSWNGETLLEDHFYIYNASAYGTRLMLYLTGEVDESQEFTVIAPLEEPYFIQLSGYVAPTNAGVNTVWTDTPEDLSVVYLDKR